YLTTRRRPPSSTLFPYTTLFRSHRRGPFAELLLQLVELGPGLLLLGVPPPGELARQPQQLVAVQVGPGVRRLARRLRGGRRPDRSEEHTSELQSLRHLVCRLLLE